MKIKTRWMDGIKQEAVKLQVAMPWERGLRRKAMIRRRSDAARRSLVGLGLSA